MFTFYNLYTENFLTMESKIIWLQISLTEVITDFTFYHSPHTEQYEAPKVTFKFSIHYSNQLLLTANLLLDFPSYLRLFS